MIIAKIYGGLGNQLFQYAAAKNIGLKFDQQVLIDKSWYDNIPDSNTKRTYLLDKFYLNEEFLKVSYGKLISRINPYVFSRGKLLRIINEKSINKISKNGHFILDGYWQSIDYFIENNQLILESLNINYLAGVTTNKLLTEIRNQNSVAIHIRRGDYITNKFAAMKHGVCSMEYYRTAISRIYLNTKNPHFFIFSDDIAWASENFNFLNNKYFIDSLSQDMPVSDLLLMSNCKNHIIANSSFSWWGAWIAWSRNTSEKSNLVIAPKKWFICGEPSPNLFPRSWLMI